MNRYNYVFMNICVHTIKCCKHVTIIFKQSMSNIHMETFKYIHKHSYIRFHTLTHTYTYKNKTCIHIRVYRNARIFIRRDTLRHRYYIYIYIYIYINLHCLMSKFLAKLTGTKWAVKFENLRMSSLKGFIFAFICTLIKHTHTLTHIYIYIYILFFLRRYLQSVRKVRRF